MLAQYLVSIENNNGCTPRNQGEEIHGTELAEYSRQATIVAVTSRQFG